MSIKSNIIAFDDPVENGSEVKKTNRKFIHSLEYEIIANLVMQQYERQGAVQFDLLFSVPQTERIPALTAEYGIKRMYKLIVTLLREFCISIPLPKTKKLNDTRISVCACDLMISADEENLSMEDIILFFERTKRGQYGAIKKFLTHQLIKQKLEMYLKERDEALLSIRAQKEIEMKALGPAERTGGGPKQIGELMNTAVIIDMNKKMSG